MNNSYVRKVIGLINMLLKMHEDFNIFINGKLIPDCYQILLDGEWAVFCLSEELAIDCHGLSRIHFNLDNIHDITIEQDGELI